MEGQEGTQQLQLVLGHKLFLLTHPDVQDIEKVRLREEVLAAVKSEGMVPLYETLVGESLLEKDQSLLEPMVANLLEPMVAKDEDELKKLDEKIADAEEEMESSELGTGASPKPKILLAASGSVAAVKFGNLCHSFSEWAEVRAVATKASLHFIDRASLPLDMVFYTDEDEWTGWKKIGDNVLHIELRRWADVLVIAPLSANTLGKVANGLCDNLLTCIIRAWDYSKPMFVAPAMNTLMWNNPFTERHLITIDELGISLIPPITKRLACGDFGNGAMAEPSLIYSTVRLFWESRTKQNDGRVS